jgi:hypothetical protein
MRPGSAEPLPIKREREVVLPRVVLNVDIPTFKIEVPTTTRDFVGCILSTAGLGGVEDREGSVVVVIVHQTEESRLLSHASEVFLLSHTCSQAPGSDLSSILHLPLGLDVATSVSFPLIFDASLASQCHLESSQLFRRTG